MTLVVGQQAEHSSLKSPAPAITLLKVYFWGTA